MKVIALGFADEPAKLQLTVTLTRIMFPFLFFVALAAWAMGILNACGTFFVPAVAPAAFNVFSTLVPLADLRVPQDPRHRPDARAWPGA